MRDLAQVEAAVESTVAEYGRLDILVANAGVGSYHPFGETPIEHVEEMIDVNLKGTIYAVRAALPHLVTSAEADVVAVASEAGRRGLPGEAVYCASKFGQVGLIRSLDHELREHGIRCTNVCPGGVATEFALAEGYGRPQDVLAGMMTADVAEVVLFALTRPRTIGSSRRRSVPWARCRGGSRGLGSLGAALHRQDQRACPQRCREVGSRAGRRRRVARRGPRRDVRAGTTSSARTAHTRSCSRTPRSTPSTSRCRTRCTSTGACRRSRPASVLLPKPLDRRPERVEGAFAAAERCGRLLMEGFMWRHHPQTEQLVELVEGGAIGDLRLVRSSFSFMLTRPGDVRLSRELDGGALLDVSCYCVSAARLLAGEPEVVHGVQTTGGDGVDTRFAGTLRFDGGRVLAEVRLRDRPSVPLGPRGRRLRRLGVGRRPLHHRLAARQAAARTATWRSSRRRRSTSTSSSWRTCRTRSAAAPLLGHADALGQARALDALLQSAAAGGAPVEP